MSDLSEKYYNIAMSKFKLEDYKGAIEDFDEAIRLNPKHADSYLARAITKNKIDDHAGAIEDFNAAGELGITEAYEFAEQLKK